MCKHFRMVATTTWHSSRYTCKILNCPLVFLNRRGGKGTDLAVAVENTQVAVVERIRIKNKKAFANRERECRGAAMAWNQWPQSRAIKWADMVWTPPGGRYIRWATSCFVEYANLPPGGVYIRWAASCFVNIRLTVYHGFFVTFFTAEWMDGSPHHTLPSSSRDMICFIELPDVQIEGDRGASDCCPLSSIHRRLASLRWCLVSKKADDLMAGVYSII